MNLNIGVYNLTSDKYNVTVQERYTKESGEEGLRLVGYYGSIQAALRALFNTVSKQSDAQTINGLLGEIDRYQKDIEQLIASVDFNKYREDSQEDLSFLD